MLHPSATDRVSDVVFGFLRYILSLMVVWGHFSPKGGVPGVPYNWTGHYAVWAFFLLSGYLMTLILSERYPASRDGLRRYLANRALRIYPPYWAALLVSAAAITLSWEACQAMGPRLRFPIDAAGWFQNIAILGLHNPQPARMVAPSWSLSTELIFYVVMGLGIARSRRLAASWFVLSVVLTAFSSSAGLARIGSLEGASLSFSLGALVYHARAGGFWRPPQWVAVLAMLLFVVHAFFAADLWASVWREGLFVSLVLSALVVVALAGLEARAMPSWFSRSDRVLGDLAYPIFLCHFQTGAIVLYLMFDSARPAGWVLMLAAFPLVHLVAWFLHRFSEAPLVALRNRIRPAGSRSAGNLV